ncbi:CD151 antigen isoform X1 [Megachile rotundata]|uniref:CD151 antigen isoform X1 n=2 Tax=Megachile rotundata TaxID=143995 RepID=UPI000614A83B|nr:PREDICTED: CD151 antigen-like isoform X1 [Megachile rotundata]
MERVFGGREENWSGFNWLVPKSSMEREIVDAYGVSSSEDGWPINMPRVGDEVTTTTTSTTGTQEETNQAIMAKSAERLPGTSGRSRTRDDGCCSVNFLKYVLHIYNMVLFLSGLVVGGIGIWTVISKHFYVSLMTTSTYPTLAYALIVAGVLAVIGSWLGCGGVASENRCVLLIYVFVVMLVFVLEAGVGALARLYEEQVGPELKMNLNRTFLENYSVRSRETNAIDQMQTEFKCCGALRFEDWLVSEWHKDEEVLREGRLVPDSCCKTQTFHCGKRDHPSNIHYTGCIYKFLETTKDHLIIVGAVGLGLSVLELFGIVLGSCLYIKLRHDFDD